jgi:hypothetical protein
MTDSVSESSLWGAGGGGAAGGGAAGDKLLLFLLPPLTVLGAFEKLIDATTSRGVIGKEGILEREN